MTEEHGPERAVLFFTPASLSLKCAASIRSPPDPKPGQARLAVPHTAAYAGEFPPASTAMLAGPICRNEEKRRCRPENAAAPPAAGAEKHHHTPAYYFPESDFSTNGIRLLLFRSPDDRRPFRRIAVPGRSRCVRTRGYEPATGRILRRHRIRRDRHSRNPRVRFHKSRYRCTGPAHPSKIFRKTCVCATVPAAGSRIAKHPSRCRKCPDSTRTGNRTIKQEAVSLSEKRPPVIRNGIRIRLPSIELFSVQPGNRIYPIRSPAQRIRRPPRQT